MSFSCIYRSFSRLETGNTGKTNENCINMPFSSVLPVFLKTERTCATKQNGLTFFFDFTSLSSLSLYTMSVEGSTSMVYGKRLERLERPVKPMKMIGRFAWFYQSF